MKLKIAGTVNDSITDGPGLRFTIFAQGCLHNCLGCHNPQTHDVNSGYYVKFSKLLESIDKNPLLDGVTFSGGEPFLQAETFSALADELIKRNLNIIVYTGFTWEELLKSGKSFLKLLKKVDYIIDGRFEKDLKSLSLNFKGSSNQRFIDVKKSLEENNIVLAKEL